MNPPSEGEMRPEYDFSGGVRGKHYQAYRAGHSVRVTEREQARAELHFVTLDPDIYKHFPDSASVNKALRSLLEKK